jgi:hypothetical protein
MTLDTQTNSRVVKAMTEPSETAPVSDSEERRRRRLELIQQFADEVAGWPSSKLKAGYAQPATIRRAEEREQRESQQASPRT